MNFNKEQLATLVNNYHQIVIANAGSGKTAILVEKFFNLILYQPIDELSRIVAITFTKKAAAEMRERLIRKVASEIANIKETDIDSKHLDQLLLLRERLSSAKIQTIHSFCQDILSEHSVKIGYNPSFSLLQEHRLRRVFKTKFYNIIGDLIENDRNYDNFFEQVTENTLFELTNRLVINYPTLFRAYNYYKNSSYDKIESDIEKFIDDEFRELYFEYFTKLRENVEIIDHSKPDYTHLIVVLDDLEQKLYQPEFYKLMIFAWDYLSKIKIGRNNFLLSVFGKEIRDLIKSTIEYYDKMDYVQNYIEVITKILNIANDLYSELEDFKQRNSFITYNDMIYKTLELLQDEELAKKISKNFDYFLIDEFQDTDDKQFEIFKTLAFYKNPTTNKFDKFLFLVGDPKQSIYGFREADVRVMKNAKGLLAQKNIEDCKVETENTLTFIDGSQKQVNLTKEQKDGTINLSSSYRLNLVNTSFINTIFKDVMNSSKFEYAIEYDELLFARNNPFLSQLPMKILSNEENIKKYGGIKFLINREVRNTETEDDELNESYGEAKSISDYIKTLINNEFKIFDGHLGEERPLRYSDVAILIRKNAQYSHLMRAFSENQIPFIISAGLGFLENQEVMDIVSFLSFLNDVNDDFHLAATLKSYFFGLTDQQIYEITSINRNSSYNISINKNSDDNNIELTLWDKLLEYQKQNIDLPESITNAIETIQNARKKAHFLNTYDLLVYLLESTEYENKFLGSPYQNFFKRNIKKLQVLIGKIVRTGIITFDEIMGELIEIQADEDVEVDSDFDETEAIPIMTIHKAKGLEFPVVVIYNANHTEKSGVEYFAFKDNYFKLSFSILGENAKQKVASPLEPIAKRYFKQVEEEEKKRLFYVAATRAKDLLIISSTLVVKNGKYMDKYTDYGFGGYYFPYLLQKLREQGKDVWNNVIKDDANENESIENNPNDINENLSVTFVDMIRSIDNNIIKEFEIVYDAELIYDFVNTEPNKYKVIKNRFEPRLMLEQVEYELPEGKISATKLQVFLHDPDEYMNKYVLGLREIDNPKYAKSTGITGAQRGTILHNTIAVCNEWIINEQVQFELLKAEVARQYYQITDEEPKNYIEDISREIADIFANDFIQKRLKYVLSSQFEYPLYYFWENHFFDVHLDLLYKDENGKYEIWDWKNNYIKDGEQYAEKIEYYSLQMKFYAWIISKLHPEQDSFTARLFFTRLTKSELEWIAEMTWSKNELLEFEEELKMNFDAMFEFVYGKNH
jgi:ATP-dependent helicase/nuclease subunit A